MTEIVIKKPWTRNEFIRSRWMDKRITWFDALCALCFGLVIWKNGGALIAACVMAIIAYMLLRLLVVPWAQWNALCNFEDQPIFTFTDRGVTISAGEKSRSDGWTAFKSANETRNFYTLKRGFSEPRFTISKQMISDKKDEAVLRALLKSNIQSHLRPNESLDS